eukprot:6033562-Pyramimonas_sp.AAC.1
MVQTSSTGALHKAMRQDPAPTGEVVAGSQVLFHPKDIVDHEPGGFRKLWARRNWTKTNFMMASL